MNTMAGYPRLRSVIAAALLACSAHLVLLTPTAGAKLPLSTYVSMSSDPGDWVGQGVASRVWESHSATVTLSGDLSWLTVRVDGGASGETYRFEFAAPPGEQLHPGLYRSVQRAAFRKPGHGGLDVHGEGRGCNRVAGQFDVKELLLDSAGDVERLWITYEQHCEGGVPALFGEVQIGMPRPHRDVIVMPAELAWPALDLGASGSTVPVTVLNVGDADLQITDAAVEGATEREFAESADDCSGVTIRPGGSCQVWIGFIPGGAGPRFASLRLTAAAERSLGPMLWGEGIGGTTRLWFGGPPGERISQGRDWSYRPGQAQFNFSFSSRRHVYLDLRGADGRWWRAIFEAPAGQNLAPGTYTDARRYGPNYPYPGFTLAGDGRACGSSTSEFTINEIEFDPDDVLLRFGATFAQRCENRLDAARGGLEYRLPVGDVTPPGSVTDLRVTRAGNTATVSWTNPSDSDHATTIVRWLHGATPPGGPLSGRLLYAGRDRTSCKLTAFVLRDISVAAFAVDTAGNVSSVATAMGPGRPPSGSPPPPASHGLAEGDNGAGTQCLPD